MAINVLSPSVFNRIAAGEVVERPASVVKELVENSLDAGAKKIKVEIEGGGIKKIVVSDDGCGISKEDLPLAFLPHATSKIRDVDDLDSIATLGFRGEALASIASVAMVSLSTKTAGSESGFKIESNGGEISKVSEVARLEGTSLSVSNLFFNTPVRAKFLKKPKSEETEVTHLMEKFMLSHPDVDFCYVVDGKQIYNHTAGGLDEVMYLIYGREVFDSLLKLSGDEDGVQVSGYVVSPKLTRPNRTYQSLFVNGRYVENYLVSACVQGAYDPLLMKGRYPIYVIKLSVPYDRVDVNVHPNKREVKFDNTSRIFGIIRRAVERALVSSNLIAEFEFTNQEESEWSKFDITQEQHPAETGFNSHQKSNIDKMSETEGASYRIKVDCDEAEKDIVTVHDYKKQGIEFIDMPDFSSVKVKPKNKNRTGGNIFFDHSGDSLLYEVELSAQKIIESQQKKEESAAKKDLPEKFEEERFLQADASEIKIVGVVFKTYILAEFDNSIYVIDQHAMHERQNFDALSKEIEKNNVAKQDLLVPYSFKLLAKDSAILEARLENLHKIGFEITQNGNTFQVNSVPFVLSGIKLEDFIQELLQDGEQNEKTASALVNEKLCQTACKHSIRAGDSVSKDEIFYLVNKIKDGVPLCPHGRPIIAKISKKDLEKMFKRTL